MRWVICLLVVLGFASPALAQDFDVLRGSEPIGPPTYRNWTGFYFGGQAAYASGGTNFGDAVKPLVAYILRNSYVEQTYNVSDWTALGEQDSSSSGFGGFVGYNTQWENLVLGIDASYTHTDWSASSSDTISRYMDDTTTTKTTYYVTVTGSSSIRLHDYAALRGWSAGLGLDVAVTPSIFLRGEYDYVQFVGLGGLGFYLNTASVGAGVRF